MPTTVPLCPDVFYLGLIAFFSHITKVSQSAFQACRGITTSARPIPLPSRRISVHILIRLERIKVREIRYMGQPDDRDPNRPFRLFSPLSCLEPDAVLLLNVNVPDAGNDAEDRKPCPFLQKFQPRLRSETSPLNLLMTKPLILSLCPPRRGAARVPTTRRRRRPCQSSPT